jgi:hypothetical protein
VILPIPTQIGNIHFSARDDQVYELCWQAIHLEPYLPQALFNGFETTLEAVADELRSTTKTENFKGKEKHRN